MISDYTSRQVLSALFPILKNEWALTDSDLASLSSIVALMVGLLTFPLSLLADRWGRVKSLVLMAILWSIATLLCAIATSFHQMLGARFLLGVGEAAYGSVGIAVVLSVFTPRLHASLSGAFMAGTCFGSVIGVAVGGVIAVQSSWRWSFAAMAVLGLVLVALFRVSVTESRLARYPLEKSPDAAHEREQYGSRAPVSSLFTNPAVLCAYAGSGLQMFSGAVLLSWLPSFFNRYYHMSPSKAGTVAAVFVLLIGAGMVLCGVLADLISRHDITRKWTVSIAFCGISLVSLGIGFSLAAGPLQLVLIGCGSFFCSASSGPTTAIVANLTHPTIRSTAFGTLTVANNLLGMALGPFLVGILADQFGLLTALKLAPLVYLVAISALVIGKLCYPAGLIRLAALHAPTAR
ncbi:MFS transporter [Streptomyces sp. NBC_00144]|uniref:MFS transporter n=1 Tax=Streptomyces sp. NBC_00144 TaxID=2975665 RepID=UPI00324B7977